MVERPMRLSVIRDEYGDDFAALAANVSVRRADDGEPYLTAEEIEHLRADLLLEGRDC